MSANVRQKRQRSRNESGASDKSSNSEASNPTPAKAAKPGIGLFMDCEDDELSEAQKQFYKVKQKAFDKVMKELEEIAKKGATLKPNATDNSVTFRVLDSTSVGPLVPVTGGPQPAGSTNTSTAGGPPTITCPPGYRLLLDPITKRIIGSVPAASLPPGGAMTNTVSSVVTPAQMARPGAATQQARGMARGKAVTLARGALRGVPGGVRGGAVAAGRGRGVAALRGGRASTPRGGAAGGARPIAPAGAKQGTPPPAGKGGPMVVDLTDPSMEPVGAPPVRLRKTFPALTVQARAQRVVPQASVKRSQLDAKVKSLLVLTPAKFTEWLIQNGLVRSEQFDEVNGVKTKLKLGMYSDGKRFAASGGYVWLHGPESATKYTSVLKGSIFEIAPSNALKLIYHWSCQTTITNVIQWVKVDNAFVDKFFALLRAVAIVSSQDKIINMGGTGQCIEIGVISLGTSSQEGSKREVRVEVLGVLERSTRNIRIRVSEPQSGANQAERFRKIFEMLPVWVNTGSKIFTDYSVDKETLTQLGYKNVVQCSLQNINNPSSQPLNTNIQVMDYLKKVVPKMFQNSLSSLTNSTLQQFLDELSYRETFGQYPLACFEDLIQKINTLTQYTAKRDEGLENYLKKVATNPFLDWRLKTGGKPPPVIARPNPSPSPSPARSATASPMPGIKRPLSAVTPPVSGGPAVARPGNVVRRATTPEEDPETILAKKMMLAKEFVELESYYYGTLQGDEAILATEFKADMAFKCQICKKVFMNNIEFMKHLHLHIESNRQTAIDFADLSQCKYCYKDFDNTISMQAHVDTVHVVKGFQYVCQICSSGFNNQAAMVIHMNKEHVKSELPYACQVCEYRTSCHKSIIEHFTEMHDRTDKLQCPLCLKVYSLFNDKGYNSAAAQSYMMHLQKHENCKKKYKCKKCMLEFTNEKVLKYHQEKDHVSYKDFSGVDSSQFLLDALAPTRMPKPDERLFKVAPKKTGPAKPLSTQYAFASVNLEDMAIYDTEKERCFECKRPMCQAGHFTAYLCCTKCRYSTCCSRAINLHGLLFHSTPKPVFDLGKPVILDNEVYCICGYSTNSGHKMAKHLATQGCSTAYYNLELAGDAREDKDLPPIKKLTPPSSPVPPEEPEDTKEEEGESGPASAREVRNKARRTAPTGFMKQDYESDQEAEDSDAVPDDGDDNDDNYEPELSLAEKYLSSEKKVNPDEDEDDPDGDVGSAADGSDNDDSNEEENNEEDGGEKENDEESNNDKESSKDKEEEKSDNEQEEENKDEDMETNEEESKDAESTKNEEENSNEGGKAEDSESRASSPAQQDDKEENQEDEKKKEGSLEEKEETTEAAAAPFTKPPFQDETVTKPPFQDETEGMDTDD